MIIVVLPCSNLRTSDFPHPQAFLLALSTYCSDPREKRRLEELSSKEGNCSRFICHHSPPRPRHVGTEEYNHVVTEDRADLVDILHGFPSCQPPLERMVGKMWEGGGGGREGFRGGRGEGGKGEGGRGGERKGGKREGGRGDERGIGRGGGREGGMDKRMEDLNLSHPHNAPFTCVQLHLPPSF